MNFTQLVDRAAYLAKQTGYQEVDPAPKWTTEVNIALADYSWDVGWNVEQGTVPTVSGTAECLMSAAGTPMWMTVKSACRDTTSELIQSDEDQTKRRDVLWYMRAAAPPIYYWIANPNTLHLHPKPDAVYTITFRGVRQAAALTATTDYPAIPDTYHEGIALRAAVRIVEPWIAAIPAQDVAERTWRTLQLYREQYGGYVDDFKRYVFANNIPKQRTVDPRLPERVGGSYGFVRRGRL